MNKEPKNCRQNTIIEPHAQAVELGCSDSEAKPGYEGNRKDQSNCYNRMRDLNPGLQATHPGRAKLALFAR